MSCRPSSFSSQPIFNGRRLARANGAEAQARADLYRALGGGWQL